jgi:hypothetical protein
MKRWKKLMQILFTYIYCFKSDTTTQQHNTTTQQHNTTQHNTTTTTLFASPEKQPYYQGVL